MQSTEHSNFETTPVKRTAITVYTEKEDLIESRKYETEKTFELGSTMTETYAKRRIEFSEIKQGHIDFLQTHLCKANSNPERRELSFLNNQRQTPVEEVLDRTSKYLKSFYSDNLLMTDKRVNEQNKSNLSNFNSNFKQRIIKLIKEIRNKPRDLVSHLNLIFYTTPSICHQRYAGIEKEILTQFGDNLLLTGIVKIWFKCLKIFMPEFGSQTYLIFSSIIYEQFCEFMAYLIYDHYKNYFSLEVSVNEKKKDFIREKLRNETVRYLLVGIKQWETIVEGTLFSSEINKNYPESPSFALRMKNELFEEIKNKELRALLEKEFEETKSIFGETKSSIIRFMKDSSLRERLRNILKIRVSLEQDILTYQRKLIESNEIKEFFLFEKDEYLTCIVLSIITHGIKFQKLDLILKKVELMMGAGMDTLLRAFKCPSYFNDIIASVDYLQEEAHKDLLKS